MVGDVYTHQPPLSAPGWEAPRRASTHDLADVELGHRIDLLSQRVDGFEANVQRVEDACQSGLREVRENQTQLLVGVIGGELLLGVLILALALFGK